jgi:hypothetical protein
MRFLGGKKKTNGGWRKLIKRSFRICILQQKALWSKEVDVWDNQQGLRRKNSQVQNLSWEILNENATCEI